MRILLSVLLASLAVVTSVNAATGSTSTGSTSTGTVSTGTTISVSNIGGGGITRWFNLTTNQFDLVPQCFPWAWLVDFYKGNIFMIYENQKACQKQRSIDFGI